MGQSQTSLVWKTYELNLSIAPGTYRIIHDGTNRVLQLQDGSHKTIVLQPRQDQDLDNNVTENDHWFLLRSGHGFIFKHCRRGTYITGRLLATNGPQSVCATMYPTTWAIHTKKDDNSKQVMCAITIAIDRGESAPLEYIGLGVAPMGLQIAQFSGKDEPDKVWRLERIGDATVEDDYTRSVSELERKLLAAANDRWTKGESKLQAMREQLDAREARLENIRSKLSKQATELESVRGELNQQATELKEQFRAIGDLLDANERPLYERDRESKSDVNATIREKEQGTFHEKESRQSPEATRKAVLDEQVYETPQDSQHAEIDNTSRLDNSVLVPKLVSEFMPSPETRVQATRSTPALDRRLAEMGWCSDSD